MRPVSGVVLAVACLLLVAACGGEGPKPETVARDYVASNAASKCDALDPALVASLTGKRGDAALAACRRNVVRFPAPRDVRVDAVKAEGGAGQEGDADKASEAEVRLIADGREAELKLHKEAGTWRIVQLGE